MSRNNIILRVFPLKVTLKATIRHASSTRDEGESIWVQASRNGKEGYGEGCPRSYVAGDDLESSVKWAKDMIESGTMHFKTLEDLKQWMTNNNNLIDEYPSAWCAIEMAILDLLAQENECSVEEILRMKNFKLDTQYSAVLGDDKTWKYRELVDKYLIKGLTDFKIKLNGVLERDRNKLLILSELSKQHNVKDIRIRVDANNLWGDNCSEAIAYIKSLGNSIFAIEEPVGAKDIENISRVSTETGMPIILDESLCTLDDLSLYNNVPGQFIANIKISRVGGLLRALQMINKIKKLGWPIIVGCHVGETSLLTRTGLIIASASGKNLIAHEGAFGDYLVEREPVYPMLKFGRYGLLNLNLPYYFITTTGLKIISPENWKNGLGMKCRVPFEPDNSAPEIKKLQVSDGYNINYRLWGPAEGDDVLIILHGGMSHSGWQAPLANKLRELDSNISIAAFDRRGCGLNENRGDFGSVELVTKDVIQQVEFLNTSFKKVHLAGWCQGAQFASVAAAELGDILSSLILLTPGFFWNERFRSVLRVTENVIMDIIDEFKLKPEREHACIPIPMEAADFTVKDQWLDYIENDDLKSTRITLKSVSIMDEIQELSWQAILNNIVPILVIIADNDRIVDNKKVLQFTEHMFNNGNKNKLVSLECGHAVQFEKPSEAATELLNFIKKL